MTRKEPCTSGWKYVNYCDFCGEKKDKIHLTSKGDDICDECIDNDDQDLKLIDPDAEYDRMRDGQLGL